MERGKKRGAREEGTCSVVEFSDRTRGYLAGNVLATRLACCIDERRDKRGRRSTKERHKNSGWISDGTFR